MKFFLLLFVNLFLLISCKKYKTAEAAFFIRTNHVAIATVNTGTVVQGSASNKVSDLFLYVNGQFQGIYPVGNLMPIVSKNNPVTINVFAGIKNNGISGTRIPYPFLDYQTFDTLVESGKTIERPFTFKYGSGVVFDWMEDFDPKTTSGITIQKSPISNVNYRFASAADSYEGKSLELWLSADTADQTIAQIESTIPYKLPAGTANLFMELNYKCNAPFAVGVVGDVDPAQRDAFILNPQGTWNKIYIQLAGVVSAAPVSTSNKIYFRMQKTADFPDPKLFLDNIKVLHL